MTRRIAGALILGIWALLSSVQSLSWRSDLTLWQATVIRQPENPRAWVNYGSALASAGDWTGAAVAWQRGWQASLTRDEATQRTIDATVRLNLARKAERDGDCEAATAWLESVQQRYPAWGLGQALAVCVWSR